MGKQRQKHVQTTVLHILFLLASYNLPSHKGNTIMEIYCALAEKRRSRSHDAKSRASVGGKETLINAKIGFVYFLHFPLSADV